MLSIVGSTASRRFGENCVPGTPESVECFDATGSGTVPGLGHVSLTQLQLIDTAPAGCGPGSLHVLGSPVRLSIAGKGTIEITVGETTGCRTLDTVLSHTRPFTVTGGTGAYSGATGSGTVRQDAAFGGRGIVGTETWEGTLSVPGLDFDTTAPVIRGATAKTVLRPRGAKLVRVTYRLTALDETDGAAAVSCRPPSGSRFKLGRTLVNCSATDKSGNTSHARFPVTVRAHR